MRRIGLIQKAILGEKNGRCGLVGRSGRFFLPCRHRQPHPLRRYQYAYTFLKPSLSYSRMADAFESAT